jgi:tRNA(Ile2) C34 agmatinyltransferase TiaS
MATIVEQIYSEISHLCRNEESAHLAAAHVAKLVDEKFTPTKRQSGPCLSCVGFVKSIGVNYCKKCGRELPTE